MRFTEEGEEVGRDVYGEGGEDGREKSVSERELRGKRRS